MPDDSTSRDEVVIVEFDRSHQAASRQLILDGLAERWGELDATLNADLDDIAATFRDGCFLVAIDRGAVVGTGGLKPVGDATAEIVRMSVASTHRRRGIGEQLVSALVACAQRAGFARVICETTSIWTSAVALYQRCGFVITHEQDSPFGPDTHFELLLTDGRDTNPR